MTTTKRVGARPAYEACDLVGVGNLRWDVPAEYAGRAIEVAFGGPKSQRETFVEGAPFKRTRNVERDTAPNYFRLVGTSHDASASYQGWQAANEIRKVARKTATPRRRR